MTRHWLFLAFAVAAITLDGCNSPSKSSSNSPGAGNSGALTIAVIPKGSTHEYWKSVHQGAEQAAQELGNVTIQWKSAEKEDDRDGQISVVEDFVTKHVDGIVLAPVDENALVKPVQEAIDASIPVVIIDSGLKQGVKTASFIATDNRKAGEAGGEELANEIGGKGSVIMLRYEEGSASTEQREQGFLDAMQKNPGIKILSDDQFAGATVDSAQKASENLIERFNTGGKFQADGVFCPNESSAYGMLRALQDANLAGKVKFVGFDSSDPLVAALKGGQINALVVQNPVKMGHDGVIAVVNCIRGKTVQPQEDTGATVVTRANMNQPEVAALLAPPKA